MVSKNTQTEIRWIEARAFVNAGRSYVILAKPLYKKFTINYDLKKQ